MTKVNCWIVQYIYKEHKHTVAYGTKCCVWDKCERDTT